MPSTSISPTTLPPRRSPTLGSWLPVTQIHSRSSCMICRISSSSRPMRPEASTSCRLSPSAITVLAPKRSMAAARRRSVSRVSYGGTSWPRLANADPFSRCRSATISASSARPVERARHVGAKQLAADRNFLILEVVEGETLRFQLEHCVSSDVSRGISAWAAASRNRSSRAKPGNGFPADLQQDRHGKRRHPVQRLMPDCALDAAQKVAEPRDVEKARGRIGPGGLQQNVVGIVPAQHVVDEVGRHRDLASGFLRGRGGGARQGRR